MSINGIGSVKTAQLAQSLATLRAQAEDLQQQLGSGQKSTTYAGLGLGRGLSVALRSQLSAISALGDSNSIVSTRLSLAQTALGQINSLSGTVKSETQATTTPTFDATGQTVPQKAAASQLDQILGILNTQAGDRYLFSGRATDQPAVESADHILNGDGTRAGFKQVLSERRQADLGSNGLGRLLIPAAVGSSVSIGEDAVNSPFGFKLSGASTTVSGATVSGPSGSPAGVSVNFGATNPSAGDSVKFSFALPDGTTSDLTLIATSSTSPGPNEFTIGATSAASAANLQTALGGAVGTLAKTQLTAASAVAASNDFFNTDASHPPQRVDGPPFDTATSLTDGTAANTVDWYVGDDATDDPRSTANARVDQSVSVSYGMRANEEGLRSVIANVAVFASMTFAVSDPNTTDGYLAMTQRVGTSLDHPPGTQTVNDIAADIAGAQTTLQSSTDRQTQAKSALTGMLQQIEGAPEEDVAARLLAVQNQLQASLQTTALLSKISLVNYLT